MTTLALKALRGGLEKYAMPPTAALQAPANMPPAAPSQPKAMQPPTAANSPIKPIAPLGQVGAKPASPVKAPAPAPIAPATTASAAPMTNQDFNAAYAKALPGVQFQSLPDGSFIPRTDLLPSPTPAAPAPAATTPAAPQPAPQQPQTPPAQPQQPAPQQQQQTPPAQQPAQPEMPKPLQELNTQLSDESVPLPQRQQTAKAGLQAHAQQNPELIQGARDAQSGKDTPQAQAYNANLETQKNEFVQQDVKRQADEAVKANPALAQNPQSFGQMLGGFAQNAMDNFNNMPMPMKIMMGVGLPLGLAGVISSLFGEGGGGMGILGLLGLGAAGLAGASGGMFGEGAQNAVTDGLFSLGQAAGMIPQVDPKDLALLKEKDPLAAMGRQPIGTRKEVGSQIAKSRGQIENLRKLQMLPEGMRARFMQRLDPSMTPEQAQLAVQNAGKIIGAYDDPKSELQNKLTRAQNYANNTGMAGWWQENVDVPLHNWWNKKGTDMNIAQKLAYQHLTMKAARCWKGYEPVPGKTPYSEDSCRPVGSKKKKQTGKERHHETKQQVGAKG